MFLAGIVQIKYCYPLASPFWCTPKASGLGSLQLQAAPRFPHPLLSAAVYLSIPGLPPGSACIDITALVLSPAPTEGSGTCRD